MKMIDTSRIDAIKKRDDLVVFIGELQRDLRDNSDSWENRDLPRFLGALAAWTDDMEGYYKNQGRTTPVAPDWKTFAEMLVAAKMYE